MVEYFVDKGVMGVGGEYLLHHLHVVCTDREPVYFHAYQLQLHQIAVTGAQSWACTKRVRVVGFWVRPNCCSLYDCVFFELS